MKKNASASSPRVPRRPTKSRVTSRLTAEQKRDIAAIAAKKDTEIDLSEIPEVLDWSGAEVGKFYPRRKRPVTIRLDEDVITWLKAFGPGYQTRVNHLLRHAMHASTESGISRRKSA